jgi:hypothetical protein
MKKNNWLKAGMAFFGLLLLLLAGIWYFIFYRPTHYERNIAAEKSIALTSDSLVTAYETNEHRCDSLFLNKALEVTGEIAEIRQDQAGKSIIILKSNDPMSNVSCTMKGKTSFKPGEQVTVKGICTGYLMNVILIESIPARHI